MTSAYYFTTLNELLLCYFFVPQVEDTMFAGLNISGSSKATPTMSTMRKLDFSGNETPPLSQQPLSSQQAPHQSLGTWDTPSTTVFHSNKPDLFSGMTVNNKMSSNGSTSLTGRGPITATSGSQVGSTGILQPTSHTKQIPASIGMGALQPNPSSGWSSGIERPGTGMGTGPSDMGAGLLQPSPSTGWSSSVSKPNPPPAGTGMGLLQPATPSSGWSSGIITQPSSGMGMQPVGMGSGLLQQPNTASGWSDNIPKLGMGGAQPSNVGTGLLQPNSPSSWSANINTSAQGDFGMGLQHSNMGTGLQTNPVASGNNWGSFGPGMQSNSNMQTAAIMQPTQNTNSGWSNNVTQSGPGMGMQSVGMGIGMESVGMGMGMLQPQSTSGWSSASGTSMGQSNNQMAFTGTGNLTTPPNSSKKNAGQGIAPGPNPFADFNSLI